MGALKLNASREGSSAVSTVGLAPAGEQCQGNTTVTDGTYSTNAEASRAGNHIPNPANKPRSLSSSAKRYLIKVAAVAVIYFLVGQLGLMLAQGANGTSWPPAGIAVAAPLLLGFRIWPGILIGAFLLGMSAGAGPLTVVAIAVGNTVEGLSAAWMINRFARGCRFWERPMDLARFSLLAGFLSPLISPPVGLVELSWKSFPFGNANFSTFMTCWLGETTSVMLLTPLAVTLSTDTSEQLRGRALLEFGVLLACLALVSAAVFGPVVSVLQAHLLPYLCLIFTVTIAFQFGSWPTTIATLLMGAIGLLGTARGYGFFASMAPHKALLALQGFIVFSAGTNLAVAAVVRQRTQAMEALQRAHGQLEIRVQQRTRALQNEIEEHKRTEVALKQAEARSQQQLAELCQVYETTPAGLFVLDRELRYARLNLRLAALNGKTIRDHLGKRIDEILPEFYADVVKRTIRPMLDAGHPVLDVDISGELPHEPGTKRHFLASFYPFKAEGPEVAGVMGAITDITDRKRAEETLRASEQRYRSLVELAPDAIMLERDGQIVLANSAAVQLFGATDPPALLGTSVFKLLHPDSRVPMGERVRDLLHGRPPRLTEERIVRLDGELVHVELSVSSFLENGCDVFQFIIRDISERQAMEHALATSEARYHRLFETAKIGVMILDSKTAQISDANPALLELLGYSREEVAGRRPWDIDLFRPYADLCQKSLTELQKSEYVRHDCIPLHTKNGSLLFLEVVSNKYEVDGMPVIQCSFRDITARKKVEQELQQAHDELEQRVKERTQELMAANRSLNTEIKQRRDTEKVLARVLDRLVEAQEDERRRVSRELHDQMGQEVNALKLRLNFLKQHLLPAPEATERLRDVEQLASAIGTDLHRLAWALRPPALDDLGLEAALRRLTAEWSKDCHIPSDFHSHGMEKQRLQAKVETTLFRLTQEALSNILKHAGASHVSVVLERRPEDISLIIEDNGKGFNASRILTLSGKTGRLGLLGMQERVFSVGGTITFESGHESGTTVFVRVPFTAAAPGSSTGEVCPRNIPLEHEDVIGAGL